MQFTHCRSKFTNLDWLILAQHKGFFLRILKPMSCFFFKTLHLQDRAQDQDLYSRDRDQDQDIKIRSRDGLETRHCLETSHHWYVDQCAPVISTYRSLLWYADHVCTCA